MKNLNSSLHQPDQAILAIIWISKSTSIIGLTKTGNLRNAIRLHNEHETDIKRT